MGKLHRVGVTLALLAPGLLACARRSSEPVGSVSLRNETAHAVQRAADAGRSDPRFDAEGSLKPSGRHIGWLELPSGFREQPGSSPSLGTYEADDMPLEAVTRFLEARLSAGRIDHRANGLSFRDAKASHTRLALPAMHVTALVTDSTARRVRLVVEDLSPPAQPPLPLDVAAREQQRERTHGQ